MGSPSGPGHARRRRRRAVASAALLLALAGVAGTVQAPSAAAAPAGGNPAPAGGGAAPGGGSAAPGDNVVLQWNQAALDGVRNSTLGPPMAARALAIVHTCAYDAWAAYDAIAAGTRFGGSLRRPAGERTPANKAKAISFAAYRAAVDLFPASRPRFDALMAQLGYDPADTTFDTTTPAGIGNFACSGVLSFRHNDGANQLGNLSPGAYSDYTGYRPANDPLVVDAPLDPATVHDPNRWQPLTYRDGGGQTVTPGFVGAHWQHVVPFALLSASQFRSLLGPARFGSAAYRNQARDLLTISANLTDQQKVIAEFWGLGPGTVQPPGIWDQFAQSVSRRRGHSLDDDAKLFFALTNAIFDAGIASWDDKVAFDSVRPITAVRFLFRGQQVLAWGGPGQGTRTIDGGSWLPYQKASFPTPPFAEYVSGHSTFSAAGAEILKTFTGSDAFGDSVTIPAGSSDFEPGTPAAPVTLSWPTFTAAANEAGLSRRYGGIHFAQGDLDGRSLGRAVATTAWLKATTYFLGLAL